MALLCLAAVSLAADAAGIENFKQHSQDQYSAGQPRAGALPALARDGVAHVINLRPPDEGPDYNEAAAATAAGMAYYNIPIASAADLNRGNVLLLDTLLRRVGDDGFLLHCASSDRVGAMMALRSAWIQGSAVTEAMTVGKRWGLSGLESEVAERLER